MISPTLFYTVSRKELRPAEMPTSLPLLLSAASFASQKRDRHVHLIPPRQPLPHGPKGVDCGGLVATIMWGARYRFQPLQYIRWLSTWLPQWAATFDLCCFDSQHTAHGRPTLVYPGADVVKERQAFTTRMAEWFFTRARFTPWAWCPTIQGFFPHEYEAHARQLAPLLRDMFCYYSDPGWGTEEDEGACPFRVGIGSLCGRAHIPFLLEVIDRVQQAIGDDIPLHLWGVKLKTLKIGVTLPGVVSLDTGAWNGLFGPEHEKRRASGLTEVQYSWRVSYPSYARRLELAQHPAQQLSLFLVSRPHRPWQPSPYAIADTLAHEEEAILRACHI